MRLATIIFVIAACGGSSSSPDSNNPGEAGGKHDSGVDVGHFDFACGGGPACSLDQVCCTMPGPPVTFGCVAPGSCPTQDKLLCDGPDDCSGGTPTCCGTEVPDGSGTFPNCGQSSIGTSCTATSACQTNLSQSCNQTSKVQLCHAAADCTDNTNDHCCTFTSGAASLTFCIDQLTANLGGATCH